MRKLKIVKVFQIDNPSFDDTIKQKRTRKSISGKDLLKFAGVIEKTDLNLIKEVIEANCEQIDVSNW